MAMSFNMKTLTGMPNAIQGALTDLQDDLTQIQESVNQLKDNMPKMKSDGGTCNSKNIVQPVPCYKEIHGPIKYTRAQRNIWEARMRDRFRAKQMTFKPEDYPTTDMIDG